MLLASYWAKFVCLCVIVPLTLLQMEKAEPEERLDKMKEDIENVIKDKDEDKDKDKSTESIEELGSIEVCT